MHELHKLEKVALHNYETFNFPRGELKFVCSFRVSVGDLRKILVVSSVSNFANITLSSLYFDIMKDTLYADERESPNRRVVAFVLKQVGLRLLFLSLI